MKVYVARGVILASSLLPWGTAAAQGTVYGTPSLLPPANTAPTPAVRSTSTARSPASSNWSAQPAAFGRRAQQPDEGETSVVTEPIPQGVPQHSPTLAPAPTAESPVTPHIERAPIASPSDHPGGTYYHGNHSQPVPNYGAPPHVHGAMQSGGGNCIGSGAGGMGAGPYGSYGMSGYDSWSGSSGECVTGHSAYPGQAIVGGGNGWYVGVGGLIMTRDNENHYLWSYDDANEAVQLTDTRDANMDWAGGFESWIGKYFNCGMNALEVGYWGLYPGQTTTTTLATQVAGNLNGILNWDQLNYGPNTGDQHVNNAQAHRVRRDFEFQNIEVNLLGFNTGCGLGACGNSSVSWNWLAGVRYFRFNEFLEFGSDPLNTVFDGQIDELYYRIRNDNNLVGFQLGGNGRFCVTDRFALTSGLKFGFYNNHINSSSVIEGAGGVATINNGPFNGRAFYFNGDKDDFAFLGELNLGFNYQLSCRWSAYGGYRALALTGVALPTNQIYSDLRGINDLETIESNGSLILHGAYAGLQFCF